MSADVLQEYLVKIGYHTDATSFHKFEESLGKTTKNVLRLGGAVTGIAIATATATATFAYNMRKMYFASQIANSSIQNLKAMGFAATQVGVSGETMESAIKGMAMAFRREPGLAEFVKNLGVPVSGRDTADVMADVVTKMNELPFFQAADTMEQYFHMDAETYYMLRENMEAFNKSKQTSLDIQKEMNVNYKEAEDAVMEFTTGLDLLGQRFDILGDKILIKFTGPFRDAIQEVNGWFNGMAFGLDNLGKEWENYLGIASKAKKQFKDDPIAFWMQGAKDFGADASSVAEFWLKGAKDFGADANAILKWLVPNVIAAESGGNPNATSSSGAMGLMQLMPDTAKRFGAKNPYDPEQNKAAGAKYLAWLLNRYHGDAALATGAYNWGEGNIDSFLSSGHGLSTKRNPRGVLPHETEEYVRKLTGANLGAYAGVGTSGVNITNTYNITGQDSKQIAESVSTKMDNTWSKITRNLSVPIQ